MKFLSWFARVALEVPILRGPIGKLVSTWRSRQLGFKVRVYRVDGEWRYETQGCILSPEAHGWSDPSSWEAEAIDIFFHSYSPKPGNIVLDVGAGIGTELFVYSKLLNGSGLIYALEAHPGTFSKLETLISLNQGHALRSEIVADCVAASDRNGVIEISDDGESFGVANSIVSFGGVRTVATTLDSYIKDNGIRRIDFLKMNIEGAELDALKGSEHTLSITIHGAIGCHDFRADPFDRSSYFRTKEAVRKILLEAGFHINERPDSADPWTRDYLYISREL